MKFIIFILKIEKELVLYNITKNLLNNWSSNYSMKIQI